MPRTLKVVVIGDTAALTGSFRKASAEANVFGKSVEKVGKAAKLAFLGIGAGAAIIGVESIKAAASFQKSMTTIHTQAGVSEAAVKQMSKGVLAMAGTVGTAPDTLAEGLYHLASQGLRGAKAMNVLKVAAEGAKVGQANLEDVTNALGAVMVSGIKGTKNMSQVMGILNATVGAGDMRMQDLADAMGTGLAAKAKIFGISIKDVSAALAVFGDNNIRGAEAGTLLNSTIRVMGAGSKAADKNLKTIGLSTLQLSNDMRGPGGLVFALSDLKTHMDKAGLSASQQAQVLSRAFGGKQAGGILILLSQLERLKTKEEEVAQGGNKFGEAWAATQKETSFQLDALKAHLDVLAIKIGSALLPAFNKVVTWINGNFPKIEQVVGTVMTAVGNLIGRAIDGIRTHWDQIKSMASTAFDGIRSAAQALGSFLGTSFGQTIAIAVGIMYGLVRAAMAAQKAIKAIVALNLTTSPLMAGLTVVGAALALFAGDFITSKLKMDVFTATINNVKAALDTLKNSLDTVRGAHIREAQSALQVQATHTQAIAAHNTYIAALKKLGPEQMRNVLNSKDQAAALDKIGPKALFASQAFQTWRASVLAHMQALVDHRAAVEASAKTWTARSAQLAAGIAPLDNLIKKEGAHTAALAKAAEGTNKYDYTSRLLKKSLDDTSTAALKASNIAANHARTLAAVDPQAAKAAAKTSAYASAIAILTNKLGRVPKKSEVVAELKQKGWKEFEAALTKVPPKAKAAGDAANKGFFAGIGKIAQSAAKAVTGGVSAVAAKAGSYYSAGLALSTSLASGIMAGVGAIRAAAATASNAATITTNKTLQHHSPSPLFIKIGKETMESLATGIVSAIPAVVAAAGGVSLRIYEAIHNSLVSGGAKGKAAVAQALKQAVQAQPAIEAAAKILGQKQAENIALGVISKQDTIATQMIAAEHAAIQKAKSDRAVAAVVAQYGQQLGVAHAQGIARGVVGATPPAWYQVKVALQAEVQKALTAAAAAVTTARGAFVSAYQGLASAALSAFDQVHQNWKPPAQTILDKLNLKAQLDQAGAAVGPDVMALYDKIGAALDAGNTKVADQLTGQLADTIAGQITGAEADLAAAQAAAAAAPDDKDAQDRVQKAQERLDGLKTAQQTLLTQIAQQEQTAHDAQVKADKDTFERRLNALINQHPRTMAEYQRQHAEIMKLLKANGITAMKIMQAGGDWDTAHALETQIDGAKAAARKLAQAIANELKVELKVTVIAPAEGGTTHKARGGHIGGSGSGDIVPAMLEPGEYVMRKAMVRRYGKGFMDLLNAGHYQEGGVIPPYLVPGSKEDTPKNRAAQAAVHDWGIDNVAGSEVHAALLGDYGRRAQVQAMERAKTIVDGQYLPRVPVIRAAAQAYSEMAPWKTLWESRYPGITFEEGTDTQVGWQRELFRLRNIGLPDPTNNPDLLMHLTDGAIHMGGDTTVQGRPESSSPLGGALGGGKRPPVMGFDRGGFTKAAGLAFLHKNEVVVPFDKIGAALDDRPVEVIVKLDRDVLVRAVTQGQQRRARSGRPGISPPDVIFP